MGRLTHKQRVFVDEYLGCWNAAEAARRAGYKGSHRQIGSENLSKPDISAEIQRRLREKSLSAEEVLARLSAQATASIGDFIRVRGNQFALDLEHVQAAGHLVRKVKQGAYGVEIELHDAQAALVQLGRHHQLFSDRIVHTWEDELVDLIVRRLIEWDEVAAELGEDDATRLFKRAGVPVAAD